MCQENSTVDWKIQVLNGLQFHTTTYLCLFLRLKRNRLWNALNIPLDFCENLIEVLHLLVFHRIDLWRHKLCWSGRSRHYILKENTKYIREKKRKHQKKEILRVWVLLWQAWLCSWASSACLRLERHSSVFSLFAYSSPCYLRTETPKSGHM